MSSYDPTMTRVLLAEDDTAISEPLARALVREGYEVTVHADGREALDGALPLRIDLDGLLVGFHADELPHRSE